MEDPMLDYRSGERLEANGFCFEETAHRQPFEMNAHSHEQAHFALILSGQVENRCDGHASLLGPLTFSYMAPDVRHRTFYRTPVRALYVSVQTSALQRLHNWRRMLAVQDFQGGEELNLAKRLYDEYRRKDGSTLLMLEGLMLQLYATMSREETRFELDRTPVWLRRAQEILHAEIGSKVVIGELAQTLGVHPVHLMRSFQGRFGQTIGEYTRNLRIELACQRLRNLAHEESLGQLALELGFSNQSQFNRVFRQAMGMTPTQFRTSGSSG